MRFSFAKVPARKAICFFQRVWFTFAENSPFRWNHPFTMNSGFYHKALKSWDSPFRKICILREVPDLSHWTHLFTCFDCSEDGFLYHGTHLFKNYGFPPRSYSSHGTCPLGKVLNQSIYSIVDMPISFRRLYRPGRKRPGMIVALLLRPPSWNIPNGLVTHCLWRTTANGALPNLPAVYRVRFTKSPLAVMPDGLPVQKNGFRTTLNSEVQCPRTWEPPLSLLNLLSLLESPHSLSFPFRHLQYSSGVRVCQ